MKMRWIWINVVGLLAAGALLASCSPADTPPAGVLPSAAPSRTPAPSETPAPQFSPSATLTPSLTPTPSDTPTPTETFTATPDTRPDPVQWSSWAAVPTVSYVARQVYEQGLAMGNDPHVFSVVGDCQSEPNVFLGIYATDRYWLGENYQYLQETIDYFHGSFERKSLAVRDGLSAPTALTPLWADKEACEENESPVACELRVRKPSILFINLGTNWRADASALAYEKYLRQIVDLVVANGTLPILTTKADNIEGDHGLNLVTARVAHDYDIPLMNFWLAAQSLENGGLDAGRDNIYLTPDGWDRRNFTALRALDAVRRALNGLPPH